MVPSTPARRAYLAFQVSVFCSARARTRASCGSLGRKVSMRLPSAEVVHCSWKGQGRQVRTICVLEGPLPGYTN